jgi:hypothetical protein
MSTWTHPTKHLIMLHHLHKDSLLLDLHIVQGINSLSGDLRELVWVGDWDSSAKSWVILCPRVELRVELERVLNLTLNSVRIDQSRGL